MDFDTAMKHCKPGQVVKMVNSSWSEYGVQYLTDGLNWLWTAGFTAGGKLNTRLLSAARRYHNYAVYAKARDETPLIGPVTRPEECMMSEPVKMAKLESIDIPVTLSRKEVNISAAHEYTGDEIRELFEEVVRERADYWVDTHSKGESITPTDLRQAVEGGMFSVLSIIDGMDPKLPRFALIPNPDLADTARRMEQGLSWFPEPVRVVHPKEIDLSGDLRKLFHKVNT